MIVTAEELVRHPNRVQPWMRDRVLHDALEVLGAASPAAAVPLRRSAALSAAAVLAAVVLPRLDAPARVGGLVERAVEQAAGRLAASTPLAVDALMRPPAYLGLPAETVRRPDRLTVIEGTTVSLALSGGEGPWVVRHGTRPIPVSEARTADVTMRESAYFAVSAAGDASPRLLIPVTVEPDRAPTIKVEEPGKDLLVPDANRTVRVRASASDDFGLRALSLRYTRVSGSGEQFEFVEGELPFTIARADQRHWTGEGELPLRTLGLEPGDSLVYRVVARDARAGDAGAASSDTYFVEVSGPGQVALEGFEMPPDQERFALSQQMIVLKIQRLRAREPRMPHERLQQEAGDIAVEQRSVRANFIFLMGGHVEDEEEEAAHSHEIQEGRLENTARQEISRAIGHMSLAEQALVATTTAVALAQARLAVEALQRAFGKNRYLLRTLPVRSRIDPSRRLTGKLEEAGDWRRVTPERRAEREGLAARDLLRRLIEVAPRLLPPGVAPGSDRALTTLAEDALAVDSSSPEWQQISSALLALGASVTAGEPPARRAEILRGLLGRIVVVARRHATDVGAGDVPAHSPLGSAWAQEMRQR